MALSLHPRVAGLGLLPLLLLAAVLCLIQLGSSGASPALPAELGESAAGETLAGLPLSFIENRGQIDRRARYYLAGRDTSVYFKRDGLRFALANQGLIPGRYALDLDFVGARAGARPVGRARKPGVVSYFKGPQARWETGLATYSKVAYPDLWPGIDLLYSGTGHQLKYSFLVRPGADPAAIQLAWHGATGTRLNRRGQLEVSTPAGVVRDDAPRSYQEIGGRRVAVESHYALAGGHGYGFRLGNYDRSRPLVIDPAVLVYSGYLGGSGDEQANNVALDSNRNLYVVGTTTSSDFPAQVGPDLSFNDTGGLDDAFIAKVRPDGRGLVYAGYIGGADRDNAINLAVDAAGAAYLGGSTSSTETSFPVIVGPDLTFNGGPQDAWVAKVRANGTGLDYAGFIGGAAAGMPAQPNEQANGIAVDSTGHAYLSGFTGSPEDTFPDGTDDGADGSAFDSVPGFDQTFNSVAPGVIDAFVVKVSAGGSGLDYATYIGGGGGDAATGLALDGAGNAHVNLFTGSNEQPQSMMNPFGAFPATPGSFDPTYNGPPGPAPGDAAAAKLNAAGTGLVYATYIGGAGEEQPFGNVVDGAGNHYVTGRTGSDESTFPDGDGFGTIPGFDQVLNTGSAGAEDAFVAKLNPTGSGLVYATYLGGSDDEQPIGIDIDSGGRAHVAGTTSSSDGTFPATGGPDSTYNGGPGDAFVAKLNADATGLDYSGYIGGSLLDEGLGMAVDSSGNAYTAGRTDSGQGDGFPLLVGPDATFNGPFGSTDAFVTKIAPRAPAAPPPPSPLRPFAGCPASSANVIAGTAGPDSLTGTSAGDRIFAAAGNDRARGLGGPDCVDLGAGGDRGTGASGRDLILGRSGRDRIAGGSSGDRLQGNSSSDRIWGNSGNDEINGGSGRDRISGGSGRDRIRGDSAGDRIAGNSGRDRMAGRGGNDRLNGGSGRDRISGGSGNDRIRSRDGTRDRVNCGSGNDRVIADSSDVVRANCETVTVAVGGSGAASASLGGLLGLLAAAAFAARRGRWLTGGRGARGWT